MNLRRKVALVTGGGRGIGKAIARAFAREGAHLVLAARSFTDVAAAAEEACAQGGRALALRADIADPKDVDAMVAAAVGEFGRIDILVNNAAVQSPIGPLWQNAPAAWLRAIQVNLGGVFLCCHAVVPVMIRGGAGKIINISGGGAATPRPNFSAYAASKAAVVRLTETLAHEVRDHNIQVNALAPGGVRTRMTAEVLAAGDAAGTVALADAQRVTEEGGTPDAAAELAVFLASDASGGLTGRLISAAWDDWRSLSQRLGTVAGSDLYTLRRVTG